ncbi:MAG: hypothetical protein A2X46_11060 [Lentisphaerae bacterium GWF2_57_35]|nr:MAG: hypothetical protein A2X46_11060 [Lentisphaerae bacterium GWF2_57_35]
MKKILNVVIVLCAGILSARAESARQELSKGTKLYRQTNYTAAAEAFSQATQKAQTEQLDPAVALFNEADALYKAGRFGEAAERYMSALKTSDLTLQEHAFYNRGNALMSLSSDQEQQQKTDEAIKSVDEAMAMYENAMALAPKDADPKVNYELALKKKEELKQKQQEQQKQQKQDQDKKDQDKKDQPQDPQNQQDQQQDQQKQDQQQEQQKEDEKKQAQEQEQSSQQEDPQEEPKEGQPKQFEEMTPEEAKMVLDSMKQEEQAKRDQMRRVIGQPVPVEKDW